MTLRTSALAVAAPMLVATVLAVSSVGYGTQRARLAADVDVRAAAATAVARVDAAVRTQLAAAPAAAGPAVRTVRPEALATAKVSRERAILARDLGRAVLDDLAEPPAVLVPLYRVGAGAPSTVAPTDTAARRRASAGYRVVPLALGPALAGAGAGGLAVLGPGGAVAQRAGAPPADARAFAAPLELPDAPGWAVRAWLPDPATPAAAWAWAVGLLVAGAAASAAVSGARRRGRAAAAAQARLERPQSLVTELAPVVQSSLDLGQVAPAVASHLSGSLGLAGLALSVPAATPGAAGERPLFTWGVAPDPAVRPGRTVPERLGAGQTYALPLTRGGRLLGVMRIVAGAPLESAELRALAAASELVTSTMANVALFEAQQELVEQLRSVDELKTVFLATASHELRTPVAAIVGFTTLLLDRGEVLPPDQARTFLERVQANGRSLDALIEQLLDFSRLERGVRPAGDELLDLGAAVARILDERPELTEHHTRRLELADGAYVQGSGHALERIVTNLVSNAAKYSPRGGEITVTVRAEGGQVVFVVDDQGPGVPAEDRERIFHRFYRGQGDLIPGARGAGVGLAIVSEYVASMSGTVAVTEAPGGGARFTVTFPAVADAESWRPTRRLGDETSDRQQVDREEAGHVASA
jgi:signal transduction histidine kinase